MLTAVTVFFRCTAILFVFLFYFIGFFTVKNIQIWVDFQEKAPAHQAVVAYFERPIALEQAFEIKEVQKVIDKAEKYAHQGLWCIGWVAYEAAPAFDPAMVTHPLNNKHPLAWFAVFDKPLPAPLPLALEKEPCLSIEKERDIHGFKAAFASVQTQIQQGDYYQLNLTAPLKGRYQPAEVQGLYQALRRAQPASFSMAIKGSDIEVASVSPELFFDWKDNKLVTQPMKGTAPRHHDPLKDKAAAQALASCEKNRAENVMIVDLIRNDLSRIALPHSVKVSRLFEIQALPHVWQMTSHIEAQTRPHTSLFEVFQALFPCGSVTGAPKIQSMKAIAALEKEARGLYCGAIGVIRPFGHTTFNVAIRTLSLHQQQWSCGIGSGLTISSQWQEEWQEGKDKQQFLYRAQAPFELISTMRLTQGKIRDFPLHLKRLQEAAAHFQFAFELDQVHAQLKTIAQRYIEGDFKLRVQMNAHGQLEATVTQAPISPSEVIVQLASCAFESSHSEFVRYKTTRRSHYEAYQPQEAEVFDTLLFNEEGQLTECTRGNIALLIDHRWFTPALSCGLLAGVERQASLLSGRLLPAILTRDDLFKASSICFMNSLRSWVPVKLRT